MNFPCIQQQDTDVCASRAIPNRRFANTGLLSKACRVLKLLCFPVACLACSTPAFAQSSSALTAVYGRGVHAYFAGNTPLAEQLFTQVIQAGSTDPRPYYFRGVLRLNQGRQFEAENDMRIGAAYEARNPGVQHSIGRALQRVQGTARRSLEQFRRKARLDRTQQGLQRTQQRYEQLNQRAPAVLRQGTQVPLTQPIQSPQLPSGSGAKPLTTEPAAVAQPLQAPATTPQMTTPQVPPAAAVQVPEADPFGAPAPVTADDDIFGGETATEAPTPAPGPEPTEADPFGEMPAPAADEADPFGEAMPEPAEPAAESTTPAEDDPFGDATESSEPAESADDDIFGESGDDGMEAEESSAEPAAEDDPFGESSEDPSDDPFGESSDDSADDPFGESDSSAAEDDPFGESSSDADEGSTDEAPADESDPFGEGMEDSNDSSEESEDEFDESDPFGPLGGAAPLPAGDAFATQASLTPAANAAADPSSQLFFALGQWLGSRGNAMSSVASRNNTVAQANFELGPTDSNLTESASAEMAFDDQMVDTTGSAEQAATDSEDADPFGDDPFAGDPFGEL